MEKKIADTLKFSDLIGEMRRIVVRKSESEYTYRDLLTDIQFTSELLDEDYFSFFWGVRNNGTVINYSEKSIRKWHEDQSWENENPECFYIVYENGMFALIKIIY